MLIIDILLYVTTGCLAGLLAGLFGLGGGIIVVPSLLFIFHFLHFANFLAMHMAAGTSLAIMLVTTGISTWEYHKRGGVMWSVYFRMLPGIILGTAGGVIIASFLDGKFLKIAFGLFLIIVSVQLFKLVPPKPQRTLPKAFGLNFFGLAVGAKSGMLGVGGGTLTVPFLTWCNMPLRNASGTSTICGFTIAIIGTLGFIISGILSKHQLQGALGYIYWPAFFGVSLGSMFTTSFGVRLSQTINADIAKRLFALLLFAVAFRLILT